MLALTFSMTILAATTALAAENFDGPSAGNFGKPTSVEASTVIGGAPTEANNINRSKDSAVIPPPFGSPSSNVPGTGELLTPDIAGISLNPGGYTVAGGNEYVFADNSGLTLPPPSVEVSASQSVYTNKFTLPDGLYNADGSIGALSIPKLGVTAKVFEEESLENLKKGVGHFKSTSCWDGNVGFAAHNRGLADYFGQIQTLKTGDKIVYTTKLGTRTYEVFFVGQIKETDFSRLGRTEDNIVTLTTCVRDVPELRWCVQARLVS
jgi:sortase A